MAQGIGTDPKSMSTVEVVVSHWKRPQNIPLILEALRKQDYHIPVTCTITVPYGSHDIDHVSWDRVFMMEPMGAWERLSIAGAYACDYTMFLDDDIMPGAGFVSQFIKVAQSFHNRFSVLGCHGRFFRFNRIEFLDLPSTPEYCHWLARCYFFKTVDLMYAIQERLRRGFIIDGRPSNMDPIMCYAISRSTGNPCYVIPSPEGTDWNLPDNDALSKEQCYESNLMECLKRLEA